MANILKVLGILIASIWLVGGIIAMCFYEYDRRSECIHHEGIIKGLFWCETDYKSNIERGYDHIALLVKSLGWPLQFLADSAEYSNEKLTPHDINAKECKKRVNAAFEMIGESAIEPEWLRKESVTSCTNMMDYNYKNGLPNYAANSTEEMQNYWEVKGKKELVERREKRKDFIEEIAHNCAKSTFKIYSVLFFNKKSGESKEEQIKFLKAAPNSTTDRKSVV